MPRFPLFLFTLFIVVVSSPGGVASPATIPSVDQRVEEGIRDGLISGAYLLVGSREGTIHARGYGRSPTGERIDGATLFDLASLTKVIATTPAVMKLAEEGRLSLVDPLSRWFPELSSHDAGRISLWQLLTHTSGLDDTPLTSSLPLVTLLGKVTETRVDGEAGRRFKYADVNFILLAEVVGRASGEPFDRYLERTIFHPLRMERTTFSGRISPDLSVAPTVIDRATLFRGVVQDENARRLGGVAGHAGLFSTAADLARFCRMILGGGELDGVRVLDERTVHQMTSPYFSRGGGVARGLGWDMASPYSSPRGIGLSPRSFGHTGYSGGSVWIDPENDLFIIFLTIRTDYRNRSAFNRLRRDVSTRVAEELLILKEIYRETEER